jgi:phosphoesterase RecJ-like protein
LIPEEEWTRAAEVIRGSTQVAVCCHVAPDGDAFGSVLALGRALEQQGKTVLMGWGSAELTVPYSYGFLAGVEKLLSPDRFPPEVETFVAVDCADVKRLELLGPNFERAVIRVNIDHHLSNSGFGDINLVDPDRASSCELVYELLRWMELPIDPEVATCLYTGVVTDTGRFQYSNTIPETLRVAAELRELGADHLTVAERVYESASLAQLRILGQVLVRARLEDGVVYSWLETKDLGDQGPEAAEDVIDLLRTVREARITMLLKEQPDGSWKGSLRSRGGGDVAAVAKSFGGGGHAAAAGFTVRGDRDEVIKKVLGRLAELKR